MLKSGDAILEAMQRDADGEFLPQLVFSEDMSTATAAEQTWREKSFHDVSENSVLKVLPLVVDLPQSTEPFMSKVAVSQAKFGSVPKTYIRTSIDKMVSPMLQDDMLANSDVDTVHILKVGHFPTLSLPKQLAEFVL